MNTNKNKHKLFMLENNCIEGENRINPGDIEAIEFSLLDVCSIQDIQTTHRLLGQYLKKGWVGRFRTCCVTVGNHVPPSPELVPHLMNNYILDLYKMDSWEAHNRFELIHPFQDLNGRVGRLIWLSKAVDEGYNFQIPFLQMYYYQTLNKNS